MVVRITIDGTTIDAAPGVTVLQAALAADLYIPALCAHPDLPPQKDMAPAASIFHGTTCVAHDPAVQGPAGCGICAVDVDGERVPSCATKVRDGMVVTSKGEAIETFRRQRMSAILAHHPHACLTCAMREGCTREPCSMSVPVRERCCSLLGRCELQAIAEYVGIDPTTPRFIPGGAERITSEPLFDRDPELCIACGRCVRACASREVNALGWVRDSAGRKWAGPIQETMAASGCRLCGSCVEACPTGALMDRSIKPAERELALVPCRSACPAGTDVPRYVRLVAKGQMEEAAAVVAERAPLVEVLGHVCFHPCEDACRRNDVNGSPISICAIKREAGAASAATWKSRLPSPMPSTGKKTAVVGSGPAGLMAAHVLRLLGHRVTLFERSPRVGGMLTHGIPLFRLPMEVVEREAGALLHGIEVRTGTPVGSGGLTVDTLRTQHDAVVLATGTPVAMTLGVEGEDREDVICGLDLLAKVSDLGQHHWAALSRPPSALVTKCIESQRVVVIGGGNVAIDCARTALRLGTNRVDVVCLEQRDSMPAFAHEIRAAEQDGIRFHTGWGIGAFVGGERLDVVLKKCTAVFDADGRFAPTYDETITSKVTADAAIVAIGQRADRSLLPQSLDGIFLAGDLAYGPRSVVEAIASGRDAALAVDKYLGGAAVFAPVLSESHGSSVLGRRENFTSLVRFEPLPSAKGSHCDVTDVQPGLGREAAILEADRCLRCDLRLRYRQPVRPPKAQRRLAFADTSIPLVPTSEGVLRFYSGKGEVLAIIGAANLREELASKGHIARDSITFEFELSPMFTQRQNEMLSQYVELHGHMPPGLGDDDDVDDLF